MNVVITSATNFEAEMIRENISKRELATNKKLHVTFHVSGIGILASGYSITKLLHQHKPDFIIQVGIAGCFNTDLPLGRVVVIKEEFVGDMGVEENGIFSDLFDMKFQDEDDKPYTKRALFNPWLKQYNMLQLDEVTGITINEISTRRARIDSIKNKYKPIVESMEGASLHYACLQMQVPFMQVRAISNYVGERDKKEWKLNEAIINLTDVMIKYLDALESVPTTTSFPSPK